MSDTRHGAARVSVGIGIAPVESIPEARLVLLDAAAAAGVDGLPRDPLPEAAPAPGRGER